MAKASEHRRRLERIRKRIARFDLACSGTLHVRKKPCGREGCRCQKGPEQWHGPYYEWTRRRDGRLAHTILNAEQVLELQAAIGNYRQIQQELQRWEAESEQIILSLGRRKSSR